MWWLSHEIQPGRPRRAPAAVVALAAICGIAMDFFTSLPLTIWWFVLLGVLALRWRCLREPRAATVALGLGWAAVFAAWHHVSREVAPPETEQLLAESASVPLQLEVRVIHPSWQTQRAWSIHPATIAVVDEVHVIAGSQNRLPLPARLRLVIEGGFMELPAGTVLRLVGRLSTPAPAANPGGFDFREWLRRQGIVGLLRVEIKDAVEVVEFRPTLWERLRNQRYELRKHAVQALERSLDSPTARVAEALLLGSRQQMPEELREAFQESGTLHVLAISGVNVGVIWLGLMRLCRLLGWSQRTTSLIVMSSLVAYAWLTDANPPIVRAVIMVLAFQAAELMNRQIGLLQSLSLAVCVVLVSNPQDLFNPGAQLSFLSVAALTTATRLWAVWDHEDETMSRWGRWVWNSFLQANLATGLVWVSTLPLVLWRYHLISFVGFVLNVFLGPLVCVLLWSGYLWLLCVPFSSWLSELPLRVFGGLLWMLIKITQGAAEWRCSHVYVAGPSAIWVAGYYMLLAGLAVLPRSAWWRGCFHAWLMWINLGLAWSLWWPKAPAGLTCEILAVGHGLAVVTHCPNRRTLVYDTGSLIGPEVAAEAVCGSIWRHGQRRVDVLVASHADADHVNGVSAVADRLSTGMLLVHRTFLDLSQSLVTEVIEGWSRAGGSCRLIAAGDQIVLDPQVTIEVWHPPAAFRGKRDNANSLVLSIRYAGRSILLTGDLEQDGLAALLSLPRRPADVLVAPHHGAKSANPPALAAWVNPAWVVVSAGDRAAAQRLSEVYPEPAQRLNTAICGMVRCVIRPDGTMKISTYRSAD